MPGAFLRDARDGTVYRLYNGNVTMVQSAGHLADLGGGPASVRSASPQELNELAQLAQAGGKVVEAGRLMSAGMTGGGLRPGGGSASIGSTIGQIGDWATKLGGLFGSKPPAPSGLPSLPALPPGSFGTPGQVGATGQAPATAAPGVRGWLERVLPGGSSGYLAAAQPTVEVQYQQRAVVPRGYVVVDMGNGQKIGMLKPLARALKLWRPSPKPPVSGWDMRAINRASGAKKRVKKLAGRVGLTATERGRSRRSSAPPSRKK